MRQGELIRRFEGRWKIEIEFEHSLIHEARTISRYSRLGSFHEQIYCQRKQLKRIIYASPIGRGKSCGCPLHRWWMSRLYSILLDGVYLLRQVQPHGGKYG